MKKIFILFFIMLFLIFIKPVFASTFDGYVYVSGRNLGIKLQTNVEVIGTYGVVNNNKIETPWLNKIEEHDIITSYCNKEINDVESLQSLIQKSNGDKESMTVRRNGTDVSFDIKAIKKDNKYTLGLYVKDYELGVGTLTFIVPNTLEFASLGHKMIDTETHGGTVYNASVTDILLPRQNHAGEKKAQILGDAVGTISKNIDNGVYGVLTDNNLTNNLTKMMVAKREEAHKGKAYILTSIEGVNVSKYEIEITSTLSQSSPDTKGLKFKVTDEALLSKTEGIIQGMSGSPIIQDDKLIGAVTHVILNNSTQGYGCYSEFMLGSLGYDLK